MGEPHPEGRSGRIVVGAAFAERAVAFGLMHCRIPYKGVEEFAYLGKRPIAVLHS
jgi:hypothetical protein